jgi:hypothetical protein
MLNLVVRKITARLQKDKSNVYTVSRSFRSAVTCCMNHGTFCTFLEVWNERKQIICIALSHALAHCCNVNCMFHRSTADVVMGALTVMSPCSTLHLTHRSHASYCVTFNPLKPSGNFTYHQV